MGSILIFSLLGILSLSLVFDRDSRWDLALSSVVVFSRKVCLKFSKDLFVAAGLLDFFGSRSWVRSPKSSLFFPGGSAVLGDVLSVLLE